MNAAFQQQRPLAFTAAVRATPSPQQAAHLRLDADRGSSKTPIRGEEKSFTAHPNVEA